LLHTFHHVLWTLSPLACIFKGQLPQRTLGLSEGSTSHCDAQVMPNGYPLDTHIKYHTEQNKMIIGVLENKTPTSLHGNYIFQNARRAFFFWNAHCNITF
jgi:hypothetical protein